MEGVRIRDSNGNIIFDHTESQVKDIGVWLIPEGTSGHKEVAINAPEGINFTVNTPYAYVKRASYVAKAKPIINGRDIVGNYYTNFEMPLPPFWYGIFDITPTSFKLAMVTQWGATKENIEIMYGCL